MAASATSINLTWTNNSTNQTSFNLDRATDPNFTQNLITENLTPATLSSYTDTAAGLVPGNTYYYRLRPFNSAGNSGNSNVASAYIPPAPPKPTNQMVTNVTANEIDIEWQDNAGEADFYQGLQYQIFRSVNHGSFSLYVTLPPTSRPAPSEYVWSDTGLTPNTYYEYHIEAVDVSGNNDFAGVNATTLLPAPTLYYSQLANNAVTVYFTIPANTTSINVYRGTASGQETLLASDVTASPYVDNTVQNGVTYYYYLTAVNSPRRKRPVQRIIPLERRRNLPVDRRRRDDDWSTAGNWLGGVVPTGDGAETLKFPAGAAQTTNVDNLPAGSDAFAGIVTSGSGYSITVDNPLVLGGGGLSLTAAGTETITPASSSTPIYLDTASTFSTISGPC